MQQYWLIYSNLYEHSDFNGHTQIRAVQISECLYIHGRRCQKQNKLSLLSTADCDTACATDVPLHRENQDDKERNGITAM